jgi:hypothetical protein
MATVHTKPAAVWEHGGCQITVVTAQSRWQILEVQPTQHARTGWRGCGQQRLDVLHALQQAIQRCPAVETHVRPCPAGAECAVMLCVEVNHLLSASAAGRSWSSTSSPPPAGRCSARCTRFPTAITAPACSIARSKSSSCQQPDGQHLAIEWGACVHAYHGVSHGNQTMFSPHNSMILRRAHRGCGALACHHITLTLHNNAGSAETQPLPICVGTCTTHTCSCTSLHRSRTEACITSVLC